MRMSGMDVLQNHCLHTHTAIPRFCGDIVLSMTRMAPGANPHTDCNAQLQDWVLSMAGGDEAALGKLYESTLSRVFGLALKICRRHDLAEEAVVETYWQAWRDASRFDLNRGGVMAWLMMICRSRALDLLRKQDDAVCMAEPEALLEFEADPGGMPLNQLISAEQAGLLHQAIHALTPTQRQLIALAFYRGLSHQEISGHAGMALGTVKSHLKRAQDTLRSVLLAAQGAHHGD